MKIKISARDVRGGTTFAASPSRLYLGGQMAEGVDRLEFELPEEWDGMGVALYIQHEDGKLMAPVLLDAENTASVNRALTEATKGVWMLGATNSAGYAAYTVPGEYATYKTIDTSGDGTEVSENQYQQFVDQVLASASAAQNAAAAAQQAQADAAESAAALDGAVERAEAAADRAESFAPEGGAVISVNGKGGAVRLDAADVGAAPAPENPVAGQYLRVKEVKEDGTLVLETAEAQGGGGGTVTVTGGFIEISENIPASERTENTCYWLNLSDPVQTVARSTAGGGTT